MLASGYRDGNNEAFVDGWLRTNDRGRWLDGRLQVLGRLDDIVTINGVNVDLLAVEDRLRAHAAIEDAIVLAVPNGAGDISVHAITQGTSVDSNVLGDWVATTLGTPAAPKAVHEVTRFELTATGKIDRRATALALGLELASGDDFGEFDEFDEDPT